MAPRVLIVTPSWDPEGGYGGQESVRVLRDGLVDEGLDVWVATREAASGDGDRVLTFGNPVGLARAARRVEADVLHLYNVEGVAATAAASALSRTPSVATVNSYWATCLFGDMHFPSGELCRGCSLEGLRRDFRERAEGEVGRRVPTPLGRLEVGRRTWLLRRMDRLTTQSAACRTQLARGGIPEADVDVVPNAASDQLLETEPTPVPDDPEVLFVGQLKASKGPDLLLEAFAAVRDQIPEAHLTLAGDGPARADLEDRARELGLDEAVTFAGYVQRPRLRELYASARVVALPTLWVDPFPRVVLEAWAHGVPLVTTTRGGPGEVVDHRRTGRVVPPYEADALAEEVADLLADDGACADLREAGREELRRYAPGEVVPGYVDVYRDLAHR